MNLDKLKGKMKEKKKTYQQGSQAIGISTTSFSKKMNGETKWNVEEINGLANFLELTDEEKLVIFLR